MNEIVTNVSKDIIPKENVSKDIIPKDIIPKENVPKDIIPKDIIPKEKKSWDIFPQYVTTMTDYLIHFTKSAKYIKKDKDAIYLLINGFTTLTHIFKITLNQANEDNSVKAIENTEKAIYYYTQFIEQMEENIMYDLNVSSNTASLFVFKKTIDQLVFEPTYKNAKTRDMLKNVDRLLCIYRSIFDILLGEGYNSLLPTKLLQVAVELCQTDSDETNYQRELNNVSLFINHFGIKKDSYEYIYLYIKKYKQFDITLEKLLQKKIHSSYEANIQETANNYIKWLIH